MHLDFEYDNSKAIKNIEKHGMAFEKAKQLWKSLSIEGDACSDIEPRWSKVGKIDGKLYTCIFTRRGQAIRIITLRRSRKKEERAYHEEISKETKKDHSGGV